LFDCIHANPAFLLDFTHADPYRLEAACVTMTMARLRTLEYIFGMLLLLLVTILTMIRRCLRIFPHFYNWTKSVYLLFVIRHYWHPR
jgi:hypothetical protein